jgi:hypothetical protein
MLSLLPSLLMDLYLGELPSRLSETTEMVKGRSEILLQNFLSKENEKMFSGRKKNS